MRSPERPPPPAREGSVLVVYGTRPEAIKMAPVVAALRRRHALRVTVCATGQHRELTEGVTDRMGLEPDIDLESMRPGQGLVVSTARILEGLDGVLRDLSPDWVLTQGDTTTAMAASLAAYYRGIAVGHVEAGLRSGDLARPFPEEANRRMIDLLAAALFAPTERARRTLLAEGVPEARIFLVGNPVIDTLQEVCMRGGAPASRDTVLVTVHRRESFGQPLAEVLAALRELAVRFPETEWFLPVHPNPQVAGPARAALAGSPNVVLSAPLEYEELVRRLRSCRLVLTDSGGLQEEAPALGKPVLVLRETTERPEGVDAGVARLVGTDRRNIVREVERLLLDPDAYAAMARPVYLYGDGLAGERIAAILAGEPWTPFVGTGAGDAGTGGAIREPVYAAEAAGLVAAAAGAAE